MGVGLLPREATPGDIALAISLLERPDSPIGKWDALGQVMANVLEAQRGTPHDILSALYSRVNKLTKERPSIQALTEWLAKGALGYLRRQGDEALLPRYRRQESRQAALEMLWATIQRTSLGELSAFEGTRLLLAQGYLAIGTAVSQEVYTPKVIVTNLPEHGVGSHLEFTDWRPRVIGSHGSVPIVRASRVTETAIWAAAIGDPHIPFQRELLGLSFLQPDREYLSGYGGWYYDSKSSAGKYVPIGHEDLVKAINKIPPETAIGTVDFVEEDASFTREIPFEPGQVASSLAHKTIGSILVRASDIHDLLPKVQTYAYAPRLR